MWAKIVKSILSHPMLSIVLGLIVIVGIAGTSYIVSREDNPSDNNAEKSASDSSSKSCSKFVQIGTVAVEQDPAGDAEAWLRFDYTNTAKEDLNCQYTITFYNSREEVLRAIPNVEDTFQAPSGQIHNGYSSTPYQEGMTARVVFP